MTTFNKLTVLENGAYAKLSSAESLLFSGLQGLANRTGNAIYCVCNNFNGLDFTPLAAELWLEKLTLPKTRTSDAWGLLNTYKGITNQYILCDMQAQPTSANIATSLAGILNALPVDVSLQEKMNGLGYAQILDVRSWTFAQMLEKYRNDFCTAFAVELNTDFAGGYGVAWGPRDYAVANKAVVLFGDAQRDSVMEMLSGCAAIYGWGPLTDGTEYDFIYDTGAHGNYYVAADAAFNLSVFSNIAETPKPAPTSAARKLSLNGTTKYVAFMMSDGDNLQWLLNRGNCAGWWGSPYRGTVPMGWTMAPALHTLAPTVWNAYIDGMTERDEIVCGASGIGYVFDNIADNAKFSQFLKLTAAFLSAAQVAPVATFGNKYPNAAYLQGYTQNTTADGVLYSSFRPWVVPSGNPQPQSYDGKAVIPTIIDLSQAQKQSDTDTQIYASNVANEILASERNPAVYLIYVNAWGGSNDPMRTAKFLYDVLTELPDIEVVKPTELLALLRQ